MIQMILIYIKVRIYFFMLHSVYGLKYYFRIFLGIENEWNAMYDSKSPLNPLDDWMVVDTSNVYTIQLESNDNGIHIYEVQFDSKTGAISRLYDMNTTINYADSTNDNLLGEFIYQSLNEADYMEYMNEYVPSNKHPKPWKDESKIGIEEFGAAEHQYITATLINLYQNKNCETLAKIQVFLI